MTQARIQNPALIVPGALDAFKQLGASAKHAEIPEAALAMVTQRAIQINGCSVCVDIHTRELEHMARAASASTSLPRGARRVVQAGHRRRKR